MGLGGVATAALPSVVRLQMVFSDRLGGCSCPRSALPLARARTAPTELLGCCSVGALQGGAAVSAAPTELWGL